MPFTGSHPAAILPFLRTPLPGSALVIGSMAPDLPYYLPSQPGLYTHTAQAIVTTDLLLGAPAWALWHGLLAAPARAAAPRPLRARLADVLVGLRTRLAPGPAALTRTPPDTREGPARLPGRSFVVRSGGWCATR